jgi:hypothetical protein
VIVFRVLVALVDSEKVVEEGAEARLGGTKKQVTKNFNFERLD